MTSLLLSPMGLLYGALVRARNARFDRGGPERLRWPVISIGNLSVGGSGKTPLVICLAQLLADHGWLPDVLSRGYGRAGHRVERVTISGSADQYGDEPLMIARAAGVPVFVGASRFEAGQMAERERTGSSERHVHLLDDGFQHRQLARDVDIVVVHSSDLRQRLLPAGRLREPLSSLKRADAIVLRAGDAELEAALRRYTKRDCAFWRVRRTLGFVGPATRALAFCAIARPADFFAELTAAGMPVAERMRFRDHHRYTLADMDRIAQTGKRSGCDAFVSTAKDAVKLTAAMRERLEAVAPLLTAPLTVELEDAAAALQTITSVITSRLAM